MSAANNHLKIGLFVLLGLVLLVAGLLAFGARSYFTPKTRFETAVEGHVSGLSVGSSVQLRGVPIGTVTRITFPWHAYPGSKSRALIVEFEVDHDLMPWPPGEVKTIVSQSVAHGLRAVVKGQGITGTSLLSLETVSPAPEPIALDYLPRYHYIPSAPGQFTRILEIVESSLANFEKLDFGSIGQGVTNALGGVRQLSAKLDKLDLEAITTNANSLLVEVKTTALKLEEAVGQVQQTLEAMDLDQLSQNADGLLTSLRETSQQLKTSLAKYSAVPLQDTFADLQQTLQTLNDVLLELKRYPAGFFLGEPPVPAMGVRPVRQSK